MDYFSQKNVLPRFSEIRPTDVVDMVREMLAQNNDLIKQLLSQKPPLTWENFLQPLEAMNESLNKAWSPIAHLHAVLETEALRKAYHEALALITAYHTQLSQHVGLYKAMEGLAQSDRFAGYTKAQRKAIENHLRDFKLSGVHLSEDKKSRLQDLQQEHSKLMTQFSENVLDATQGFVLIVTDENQLAGLPSHARQLAEDHAKKRGVTGHVFTLDFPSYYSGVRFLRDRGLRRQLYEAYVTRASDLGPCANKWDNTMVMERLVALRHKIAQLVGFSDYATYSLATKMAKTPDEVLGFLNDLLVQSKPIAEKEHQALVELAKSDGVELAAWDLSYYTEKLQEKTYQFSQEDLRPYFPCEKVLSGLFALSNRLYGLVLREEREIDVWHPDVRFFSVYDKDQALRGGFYLDLYARAHKRDGAWMDDCRVRYLQNGQVQHPVAYLTCNFMPPVPGLPGLLTHDDVLTLFHEFGHCLHHLLTQVDCPSVAGINGVPWDAVEFPSQFMENFCWEKEMLALLSEHYQTGEPLPDALYQKMMAAKHFQTGLQMVRQIEFALFDFRLHLEFRPQASQVKPFVQSVLDKVRELTAMMPVPAFNRFQHSFSHIFAGGYAAGYYSYKWAEVLSADAYGMFEQNGIFDRETGLSFMRNILEVGGVPDPMDAFVAFRGRKPMRDALLVQCGII